MNDWTRLAKLAEKYRKEYPPGTRIKLIEMDDPYSPVPAGTLGSVDYVDDACQIHMKWDNGRTLPIVPSQDRFRKLTQQEIDEENDAICVEETVEEDINDEQGDGFVQSM